MVRQPSFYKFLVGFLIGMSLACGGPRAGTRGLPTTTNLKRPVPTQLGGKAWRIAFVGDRRGEVHPCGCGRQPAGGMAALAGRLVQSAREGPVLFLDLGQYSAGPTPADRKKSADLVLDLYGDLARTTGAKVLVTPGPNDPEPFETPYDGPLAVTETDPNLPGVRRTTVRVGALGVNICALATDGLEVPDREAERIASIEKTFAGTPEQVKVALVTGGAGVPAEPLARRIWRETSADLVLWTENGLGYVEGQQGPVLAASGDPGSLCEIEIRPSGLVANRVILDVMRFGHPEIERRLKAIEQSGKAN